MNESFTSDNLKKDEINTEDCEYKNLITRLSEIRLTIALLEKKYINKLEIVDLWLSQLVFFTDWGLIIKEYLTLLSARILPFLSSILPRIGWEAISLIRFSSDICLKDS